MSPEALFTIEDAAAPAADTAELIAESTAWVAGTATPAEAVACTSIVAPAATEPLTRLVATEAIAEISGAAADKFELMAEAIAESELIGETTDPTREVAALPTPPTTDPDPLRIPLLPTTALLLEEAVDKTKPVVVELVGEAVIPSTGLVDEAKLPKPALTEDAALPKFESTEERALFTLDNAAPAKVLVLLGAEDGVSAVIEMDEDDTLCDTPLEVAIVRLETTLPIPDWIEESTLLKSDAAEEI